MDGVDKFAGCFGKVAITLLIAVLGMVAGGWVLSVVWGWFIVPVFGAPSLTIAQALGVGIVGSLLSPHAQASQDNEGKDWLELLTEAIVKAIGTPLMVFAMAWLIKGFL